MWLKTGSGKQLLTKYVQGSHKVEINPKYCGLYDGSPDVIDGVEAVERKK